MSKNIPASVAPESYLQYNKTGMLAGEQWEEMVKKYSVSGPQTRERKHGLKTNRTGLIFYLKKKIDGTSD